MGRAPTRRTSPFPKDEHRGGWFELADFPAFGRVSATSRDTYPRWRKPLSPCYGPSVDLYAELRTLAGALHDARIDYALCGAVALAVHGVPRATRDIDILARPEDLDALRGVVRALGFTVEALPMTFSGSGIQMHRFTKLGDASSEPLMLDVLLAQPPIEAVFHAREEVALEVGTAWVVSRAGLVTLKLAAGRPQDLADLRKLEELGDA